MAYKTSPIWVPSKEEFAKICKEANSIAEILRHFSLKNDGNYKTVKRRILEEGVDVSHISFGLSHLKGKPSRRKYSKEEVYSAISRGDIKERGHLKKYLIRYELIPSEKCAICGQGRVWNNLPLVLQLDHIDGDSLNNKLSNLRFLCPHCHTQTETFSGKHNRSFKKGACNSCGKETPKSLTRKLKIEWPSNEELTCIVWKKPLTIIGRELGVSGNAVKKRCKKLGIELPKQGYHLTK